MTDHSDASDTSTSTDARFGANTPHHTPVLYRLARRHDNPVVARLVDEDSRRPYPAYTLATPEGDLEVRERPGDRGTIDLRVSDLRFVAQVTPGTERDIRAYHDKFRVRLDHEHDEASDADDVVRVFVTELDR